MKLQFEVTCISEDKRHLSQFSSSVSHITNKFNATTMRKDKIIPSKQPF